GGFGQYLAELTTAVKYGIDICHVLLHNGELGKISKEQRAGDWDVWATKLTNPNIADYVNSCGGLGIRVTEPGELVEAIGQALEHDGPATVEVMADANLV
ncbi:MAG: thiamine pyrophosphate-dependent enzyme, partial [Planctomycetota bacterium]